MATTEYTVVTEQVNTYDEKSKEFSATGRGGTLNLDPSDANTKRLLDLGSIKASKDVTDEDTTAPQSPATSPDDGTTDTGGPVTSGPPTSPTP